jgi:hypothetical protein
LELVEHVKDSAFQQAVATMLRAGPPPLRSADLAAAAGSQHGAASLRRAACGRPSSMRWRGGTSANVRGEEALLQDAECQRRNAIASPVSAIYRLWRQVGHRHGGRTFADRREHMTAVASAAGRATRWEGAYQRGTMLLDNPQQHVGRQWRPPAGQSWPASSFHRSLALLW